ncbi:MAG: protein meaA [Myxococcales bacterium]|nr:protein meaA [Myxococcales bacterium]
MGNTREVSTKPWIFRTYAGHTSARASNELFRRNLAAGQTGLSIAFDLPTQCGYSSDHPLALPEVGKVGVPINSLDDLRVLFDGLPLQDMNTSMTINGTAMWLLALYIALAQERGVPLGTLRGTTQNDIAKEYLARGTFVFPPEPSFALIAEAYEFCVAEMPAWNPSNVCSYHLQEAGATPVQEVAFALANALGLLDLLVARGNLDAASLAQCVGRISFFVNSGTRFIEEMCKMRAFTQLWDELTRDRYGVTDPKLRELRYGVQVNSLGLTVHEPENNAWRIFTGALGVTLSARARCRALQLPAWNEALSLPRPWDQQWSLRLQQVLAYETDLLEYPDLFDGSPVVAAKTQQILDGVRAELAHIAAQGGIRATIESGYLKRALVTSMAARMARIGSGEQVVVGVNRWSDGLTSPLVSGEDQGRFEPPSSANDEALHALEHTRRTRDTDRATRALAALTEAAKRGSGLLPASIECAHARVTTGEWADALRAVYGEYRAATGLEGATAASATTAAHLARVQARVAERTARTGHRPKLLVGKPGLDGHSNGAEMIALGARDAGFEVVYAGIRSEPRALAITAVQEAVDVIGLSILSGSHLELVTAMRAALRDAGGADIPMVVGGIIPPQDVDALLAAGVARVFAAADASIAQVISEVVDVLEAAAP